MATKILFRKSLAEENEFETAKKYYEELEKDVQNLGGVLINSYKQHRYVADMNVWYWDLEEFTPKTYFQYDDVRMWDEHSFIVKGKTNSRKHRWSTHMFARSRKDILQVMYRLEEDQFIDQQGLVIREYEPFVGNGYCSTSRRSLATCGIERRKYEWTFLYWADSFLF